MLFEPFNILPEPVLRWLVIGLLALSAATLLVPMVARAAPTDDVSQLQHEWEVIRYEAPAAQREKRLAELSERARRMVEAHPGRSDLLVWQGIVVSSLAGEKGGLAGLSLAKEAKALYESAIRIDGAVLDGSAYNSLGVLYYKVPGWPLGFGDKARAEELLKKALAISPKGIDANYFYAEFLVETGQGQKAGPYLERALLAQPRPGREIADAGRKAEARALLEKVSQR
jgi:tetratricopeptide (TPR) repeat protein